MDSPTAPNVLTVCSTVYRREYDQEEAGKGERSVYRRKDGRCVGEYEDANVKRRYISCKTKGYGGL